MTTSKLPILGLLALGLSGCASFSEGLAQRSCGELLGDIHRVRSIPTYPINGYTDNYTIAIQLLKPTLEGRLITEYGNRCGYTAQRHDELIDAIRDGR